MNKKGQISIDLMMTVLAVLIFVQMFTPMVTQFTESSREMSVLNQEKAIAFQLLKAIGTSNSLYNPYQKSSGETRIFVPYIYEPGKTSGQTCLVQILPATATDCINQSTGDNPCIIISYKIKKDSATKDVNYVVDLNAIPPEFLKPEARCGETLEFIWSWP